MLRSPFGERSGANNMTKLNWILLGILITLLLLNLYLYLFGSNYRGEYMKKSKAQKIEPLMTIRGIKLSSTPSGQRELIREYRNKTNELIHAFNQHLEEHNPDTRKKLPSKIDWERLESHVYDEFWKYDEEKFSHETLVKNIIQLFKEEVEK